MNTLVVITLPLLAFATFYTDMYAYPNKSELIKTSITKAVGAVIVGFMSMFSVLMAV